MTTICTTYCNKAHDLVDGVPINHLCFVLPVEGLTAEHKGDFNEANRLFQVWRESGGRRIHRGRKKPR